jgi:hypothetical protein
MPDRHPWLCLAAIVLIYGVGYWLHPSPVFISTDESAYVQQAVAFAQGRVVGDSLYPPGTSMLQTPFVALTGWRSAAWASFFAAAATVLLLARWLRDAGYHPAFAVLFLAYAPTLVMARIGSSDMPSAAVVTLGLWLFWTGRGAPWRWAAAGWVAGLSVLFRETNIVLLLPFVVAAALRRDPGWMVLTASVAAGIGTALLTSWAVGDSLTGVRVAGWSWSAVRDSGAIYALCTLVLVPGGLAAVVAYRGKERLALSAAVAGYVAIYLFYDYSGQDSAPIVRTATAGRYLIPLVPLLTIAVAHCLSQGVFTIAIRRLAAAAFAVTAAAAFAVHPLVQAWSRPDADIVRNIVEIAGSGALIADVGQQKYVAPMYGQFDRFWMIDTPVNDLPALMARYASAHIVHVDRSETTRMQSMSVEPLSYIAAAARHCRLEAVLDRWYGDTRRVQMWRLSACGLVDP